jgi:hypothetical protein
LGHVGFLVAVIDLARFLTFSLRLTLVSQMLVFETEGDEGGLMAVGRGDEVARAENSSMTAGERER